MIKTEMTLTSRNADVQVGELIDFAEKLKVMYPKDREFFWVTVSADGLHITDIVGD